MKSWNELRKAATASSKRWSDVRDGLPCDTWMKNRPDRRGGKVALGG